MYIRIFSYLVTETGALDYLTEGLSPNGGGRRCSTSSVGSRSGAGDRDSLLPPAPESASSSSGGRDDDALSTSTREVCVGPV